MPITPSLRIKIGPQRRMNIYVGFEFSTIIRYVEPLTGDLFTARFANCHFDETVFPSLGGDRNVNIQQERRELSWPVHTLSHNDPPTAQREIEVRRIIDLQKVADSLPDAFSDLAKVTRSHISAANVPARLEVPTKGHGTSAPTIGDHGAATTHSGGVVEAVVP